MYINTLVGDYNYNRDMEAVLISTIDFRQTTVCLAERNN